MHSALHQRQRYLGKDIPIGGTAHQAGTSRLGADAVEKTTWVVGDASIRTLVRRLIGHALSETRGSIRCCRQIMLIAALVALVYVFGVVRLARPLRTLAYGRTPGRTSTLCYAPGGFLAKELP